MSEEDNVKPKLTKIETKAVNPPQPSSPQKPFSLDTHVTDHFYKVASTYEGRDKIVKFF